MTTFTVEWGSTDPSGGARTLTTVQELDALLDQVQNLRSIDGLPFRISILADGEYDEGLPVGIQTSLGHPQRASLLYLGPDGSGTAYDPGLPAWQGAAIDFDFGGIPTEEDSDQLTLTPEQARQVAREYVQTGRRPQSVSWTDDK
jgi:hypothetical protein